MVEIDGTTRFQEMVAGLKVGDSLAFAQFCDWFEPFLMRLVQCELGERGLAWIDPADICQEVLIGFWEICPRLIFEGARSIRRYLAKMARSRILDLLRHSRAACRDRRRTERSSLEEDSVAGGAMDPRDEVMLREYFDRVRGVLNERQQLICQWRCGNMSWDEIAARLGATVPSAQKLMQRAYARVEDDLGRDDSAYVPRRIRLSPLTARRRGSGARRPGSRKRGRRRTDGGECGGGEQ